MKRVLAILLMLLLPLHAGFAAAATYCQHPKESSRAAHFGHHTHQHQAAADLPADAGGQVDSDCGFCHLSAASFAPTLPPVLGVSPPSRFVTLPGSDLNSAVVPPLDRPPLARLA